MTQEEKAKAYDKVREKIALRFGSNVAEEIFSEYEESEDERIRKALINGFNKLDKSAVWNNGITNGQILAWLEKQGEHAKFRDSIQVGDKVTRNRDGVLVNLSQLKRVAKRDEKQGEQKPAWSKEDDNIIEWLIGYLEYQIMNATITEEKNNCLNAISILKSLRERYTWKPSDEQIKALANALSLAKNCGEESAFDLRTLYEQIKKLREE